MLAPTTLLAEQHYQTLVDRFGPWPVKVAELSRFRSPKEVKAALEGMAKRRDRHRRRNPQAAVGSDVKFKRLGLLIIDEEHRFGVRHKEAIKAHAGRGGRADADGHADPAHAGHGAGGAARPER